MLCLVSSAKNRLTRLEISSQSLRVRWNWRWLAICTTVQDSFVCPFVRRSTIEEGSDR